MGNDIQYRVEELCANCRLLILLITSEYNKILSKIRILKVDTEEIKRLGKRFRKLDIDGSGGLSKEEFMQIANLQQNPLAQRVIDLFDKDCNGEVDFKEFIEGISQFSMRGDREAKLRCIYFRFSIL